MKVLPRQGRRIPIDYSAQENAHIVSLIRPALFLFVPVHRVTIMQSWADDLNFCISSGAVTRRVLHIHKTS